jgi:hypothetical protein
MSDDESAYNPDGEEDEEEDEETEELGNWRAATGAAIGPPTRIRTYPPALPTMNSLSQAAASLDENNSPPIVPIPFDLLRNKRLDFGKDHDFLVETHCYMQAFAAQDYTPLEPENQSQEEREEMLHIWMTEYNSQRTELNRKVRAAIEHHIIAVACEMGLTLEGQKPTGFRDVMAIVGEGKNWKGDGEKLMQKFVYRAKYGEFADKAAIWIRRAEGDWKTKNNIVYKPHDPTKNVIHARTQSSFHRFLVTKKNETVKMFSRAEMRVTKGNLVRERGHTKTDDLWDVISTKVYDGAGQVVRMKRGLTDEQRSRAMATIGLKLQHLGEEEEQEVAPPNVDTNDNNQRQQEAGAIAEETGPTHVEPLVRVDWEENLRRSFAVARGCATSHRIGEIIREAMITQREEYTTSSSGTRSQEDETSDGGSYSQRGSDPSGDVDLQADDSVDDFDSQSVNATYAEYKEKLDEQTDPKSKDHILHVLGKMRKHLRPKKVRRRQKEVEQSPTLSSQSDEETDNRKQVSTKTAQIEENEDNSSESSEEQDNFKQVSTTTPLRLCENYKKCKYCVCHCCYVRILKETKQSTTTEMTRQSQQKQHHSPSKGVRKRTRGREETVQCVHEPQTLWLEEENPLYFRKAYVEKKGEDYAYPTTCSQCEKSLVIDV